MLTSFSISICLSKELYNFEKEWSKIDDILQSNYDS